MSEQQVAAAAPLPAPAPWIITVCSVDELWAYGKTQDNSVPLRLGKATGSAPNDRYKLDWTLHASVDPVALPVEATVRRFLEIIHAQADRSIGAADQRGILQMCRIHPDRKNSVVPSTFAIGKVDKMVKVATADATHGHNVYMEGRTLRADVKRSKRGSLADTACVFALVIDSDNDKGKGGNVTAEPSLVVESSPGNYHFWYFLDHAIVAEQAKEIGKAIRESSGADYDTGNVVQPYRIAGTPNFPDAIKRQRGRVVVPTSIADYSGKLWTPEDLLEAFKPAPRAEKADCGEGACVDENESALPEDLLQLIVHGDAVGFRSERFHSVVARLKKRGWPLDAIVTLLEKYPNGIANKYADLDRVREEAERSYNKIDAGRSTLPTISLNKGDIPRIIVDIEAALKRNNVPVFSRAGSLVYPIYEEMDAGRGRKTVVAKFNRFTAESLQIEMARSANFIAWRLARNGEMVSYTADPPPHIAKLMLVNNRHWQAPNVTGIVTTPVLRSDGSLLAGDRASYDVATRLYYIPGVVMPAIAEQPTKEDARAALGLLDGLFDETPFVNAIDRAVALSGILTAVVRGSIPVAPLNLIRARTAGTGKSYLVDVISAILTGKWCPVMAVPPSEEELEKRLGALVIGGVPMISLDNADQDIGGAALCQLVERPVVSLRILGRSEQPEFACRAAVFATGNNIGVRGDMTRRTLICNLDAGVERPEVCKFKRSPIDEVLADRGRYVAAALTVIRSYLRAGAPKVYDQLGSYGEWSRMVRGPLMWLDQPDPVASMQAAREDDPELANIRELFLSGWLTLGRMYRVRDIVSAAQGNDDFEDLLLRAAGDRGEISRERLGWWLRKISGRVVGTPLGDG